MLIVLAAGYLNGYATEYKYSTIFVTISAIGSAPLVENMDIFTNKRILSYKQLKIFYFSMSNHLTLLFFLIQIYIKQYIVSME